MKTDRYDLFCTVVCFFLMLAMFPYELVLHTVFANFLVLTVSLVVWLSLAIGCFYNPYINAKRIVAAIAFTAIYSIVLMLHLSDGDLYSLFWNGKLKDAVILFALPFVALVPICFFSRLVNSLISEKRPVLHIKRKKSFVESVGDTINQKRTIIQAINKYFDELNVQTSLVSLILVCSESDVGLKTAFNRNRTVVFKRLKAELFPQISNYERLRFPRSVDGILSYRELLEQEIDRLRVILNSNR